MAKSLWTRTSITEAKKEIKSLVDACDSGPKKLECVLSLISNTDGDTSSAVVLKRFVSCISALVQHERYGGLSSSQVGEIVAIANGILKTQNIDPERSELSFLYAEIHLVMGQLHRKEGQHWAAAWEQSLALRYVDPRLTEDYKFQALAVANRLQRIGDNQSALPIYEEAESISQSDKVFFRTRLSRIISFRLSGQWEEAQKLIEDSLNRDDVPDDIRTEIGWEVLCLQAQESQNLAKMLKAVSKDGTHGHVACVVESALWGMSTYSKSWLSKIPKLSSLKRRAGVRPHALGSLYRAALAIQQMYDSEIPYPIRLRELGYGLDQVDQVVGIDGEVLCWLAATRALVRTKNLDFARLCLGRYRSLSNSLTNFQSLDCLGLAEDLLHKPI